MLRNSSKNRRGVNQKYDVVDYEKYLAAV